MTATMMRVLSRGVGTNLDDKQPGTILGEVNER